MRIHVTGNAGAGKTTLAKHLARKHNLPVFHLDRVVWKTGWKKTAIEERDQKVNDMIARPAWVIDGVSHEVREAADLTIFLDVPRGLCMVRCFRRNLPYLLRSRPELPDGCPELLIVPQLLRIIWRFPSLVRPIILGAMAEDQRIIRVRHAREIEAIDLTSYSMPVNH